MCVLSEKMSAHAVLFASRSWWNSGRVALEEVVLEPPAPAPGAEFSCACSCPAPVPASTIRVERISGWSVVVLSVSVVLLAVINFWQCRRAAIAFRMSEVAVAQYDAGHREAESIADRRSAYVRGLRRGGGTLA